MSQADDFIKKKVKLRAMHLLERMDRTERGLREKLEQSDYPQDAVEEAIAYVKSYGYIDDHRYALNYIRYRLGQKSRVQLMQALHQKGVSKEIACQAWEEISAEENTDERELIRSLVLKKCKGNTELDVKEYRRLQGYLARRGFSWEDISHVLQMENISMKT